MEEIKTIVEKFINKQKFKKTYFEIRIYNTTTGYVCKIYDQEVHGEVNYKSELICYSDDNNNFAHKAIRKDRALEMGFWRVEKNIDRIKNLSFLH